MVENKIYFGKKFYQDKVTGYWISTCYPRIRAHRWVWISHYGKIPPKYHVHHRDGNKSNNEIENLELVERSRHVRDHATPQSSERARKKINEIRHLTVAWHRSLEGRKWHKWHGISCWKKRKEIRVICKQCGLLQFTKTYHQEFCSNKCKSAWRRASGVDNVVRNCIYCGKEFYVNRYSGTLYCSRSCGIKQSWIDRKRR